MRLFLAMAAAVVGSIALSACNVSPRNDPPVWQSTVQRSLNAAAVCVVAALDKEFHSDLPASVMSSITHSIQIKVPERVFEVLPQQQQSGGEMYFVRLTAVSPTATNIELHSIKIGPWKNQVQPAVMSCA